MKQEHGFQAFRFWACLVMALAALGFAAPPASAGIHEIWLSPFPEDGSQGVIVIPTNSPPTSDPFVTTNMTVPLLAIANTGWVFDRWTIEQGAADAFVVSTFASNSTLRFRFATDALVVLKAYFKKADIRLTIISTNRFGTVVGNPQPFAGSALVPYGTTAVVRVTSPFSVNPPQNTSREVSDGFDGTGSAPASGAPDSVTFPMTQDSTVKWRWRREHLLTLSVTPDGGGTVNPPVPGGWYADGTVTQLIATPQAGYFFSYWSGPVDMPTYLPNNQVTMNGPKTIQAVFSDGVVDNDQDGLPDNWEKQFGLATDSATGNSGRFGDPDNDGLSNWQEFEISYISFTNYTALQASPINADSDGDGMDDGYEYNYITNTVLPDGTVVPGKAVVEPGGRFGPEGNADGDFKWDTESGYVTRDPLRNMDEYLGPDDQPPGTWTVPVLVSGVTEPVYRFTVNPADSGDQSISVIVDSEGGDGSGDGDGYDDGFEYSWDKWQQAHAGESVLNLTITNFWPSITATVPAWPASRRFNPGARHPDPVNRSGDSDYDRWYDQESGRATERFYTDVQEYHASEYATNLARTAYPIVRLNPPFAGNPWCTNPFMWDTDGDGLPDGWEMSFGYDPWSVNSDNDALLDGDENPDGDWYARDAAGNRHNEVYLAHGFHPNTGYNTVPPVTHKGQPNTVQFVNLEEIRGDGNVPDYGAGLPNTDANPMHPYKIDSDADGIWDGWELYVGLNAADDTDSGDDVDLPAPPGDGLSALDEFRSWATSTNIFGLLYNLPEWRNKLRPSDPWDKDTDWDQVFDGAEKALFNYAGPTTTVTSVIDGQTAEITYQWFTGGGMNPTTVDTDGDNLPDAWEGTFPGEDIGGAWAGGMNGTVADAEGDYDGDGLANYQEYMVGSVYMWQFKYNDGSFAWAPGMGLYGYEPYDFFDPSLSAGGQWYVGPGGREPKAWDPHRIIGPIWHPVDYRYMTACETLTGLRYSTTYPDTRDSDLDGMDDGWEVFHGLSPVFGQIDLVNSKLYGVDVPVPGLLEHLVYLGNPDVRLYPWVGGYPNTDVDNDQLPNVFEAVQQNLPNPQYYHTDPSPLWITDVSSQESFVNLYYWLGGRFGSQYEWYWDELVLALMADPPSWMFSFEINEGFDTDNDNVSDHPELVSDPSSPGVTDPLESMSPIKRRALYVDGQFSAARTRLNYAHLADDFLTFTVEAWVRPQNPTSGVEQIIIERPGMIPQGNIMGLAPGLRVNFRLGITPDGRPFARYDGSGQDVVFVEASAPSLVTLKPDQWTHLAMTYDGAMLRLYADGRMLASTPSAEIPANGWIGTLAGSNVIVGGLVSMPIVVGSGDTNPDGWTDAATVPVLVGPYAGLTHSYPQLHHYYQGWVDEVRIWNGARAQTEIQSLMQQRLSRAQVTALADAPVLTGTNVALRYAFSFDDLPDPDHSTPAPFGFDLINTRPAGYGEIPLWGQSAMRAVAYPDYLYLPWIENAVVHKSLATPRDTTYVWSTNSLFPNTSNPYGFVYKTALNAGLEFHPQLPEPSGLISAITALTNSAHYADMLPLGWAQADEDTPMWDGGGTPAIDPFDSDGDGMPDDWEIQYGLDPLSADGDSGATGDADGDGLSNLTEYMLNLSPMAVDSDGDGTLDGDEDADGDGLSNLVEQDVYLSDPSRKDTDDDGGLDGVEVAGGTYPDSSVSPYIMRSLEFGATNGSVRQVRVQGTSHLSFRNEWTLEFLVKPQKTPAAGVVWPLVSAQMTNGATTSINYEIGLKNQGRPYALFSIAGVTGRAEVVGGAALPTNKWTHLAARYQNNVLTLLVDGSSVAGLNINALCATGVPQIVMGCDAFKGELKEVRIWRLGRSNSDIDAFKGRSLLFGASSADDGYLHVNGTGYLQESATTQDPRTGAFVDELTYWTLEAWVRAAPGSSGLLIARENADNFNGTDYNYYLGIDAQGRLYGHFAVEYVTLAGALVVNTTINDITGARIVSDGQWHHVAYVRSPAATYLYVDGTLDQRGNAGVYSGADFPIDLNTWTVRSMAGPLIIGRGIVGDMEEIRVWNRPLSTAEINRYNKENLVGSTPGLVSYFNFDYQIGNNANDKSILRDQTQESGLYVAGAVRQATAGRGPPILIVPLRSYAVVALTGYYPCDDGGNTVVADIGHNTLEDFMWGRDWAADWAHAGVLGGDVRFKVIPGGELNEMVDGDGDGMPSWWETIYGLDPGLASGVDGAWGDPDGDGLVNLYEFLAGTDPRNPDSNQDGFNDFNSWSGTVYQTFGEIYTDLDGMPDDWEVQHGLDPLLYDAEGDYDGDGWNNLSEFMAGTDPASDTNAPAPTLSGTIKYAGSVTNIPVVWAFQTATMDGPPAAVANCSNRTFVVSGLRQGDVYLFGFMDANRNGAWDPGEPSGLGERQPVKLGLGDVSGAVVGIADQSANPWYPAFGWPAQGSGPYLVKMYSTSGGTTKLFEKIITGRSFFMMNDYMQVSGYTFGLPPGPYQWQVWNAQGTVMYSQSQTNILPVTPAVPVPTAPIGETEIVHGMADLSWTCSTPSAGFRLMIRKAGSATWLHDSTFVAPARSISGGYTIRFPMLFGSGVWTNGLYYWKLSSLVPSSTYSSFSTEQAFRVNLQSPPLGAPAITGRIVYFGKAGGTSDLTNMVVQAFENYGFSGSPAAQSVLTYVCNTSSPTYEKGAFALRGLYKTRYYTRAFLDMNGNGKADAWEPIGYGAIGTNSFRPTPMELGGSDNLIQGIRIIIIDRDSDNDGLPDAWEYHYFGTLAYGPSGDNDGDGLSNQIEYNSTLYDSDPTKADSDGDGIGDAQELAQGTDPMSSDSDSDGLADRWEILNGLSPVRADTDGDTLGDGAEVNLYHTSPLRVDTDGDAAGDGAEILAGTDPLDPRDVLTAVVEKGPTPTGSGATPTVRIRWDGKAGVRYRVQQSWDLKTWQDVTGSEFLGSGSAASYTDGATGSDQGRFYRVRVMP